MNKRLFLILTLLSSFLLVFNQTNASICIGTITNNTEHSFVFLYSVPVNIKAVYGPIHQIPMLSQRKDREFISHRNRISVNSKAVMLLTDAYIPTAFDEKEDDMNMIMIMLDDKAVARIRVHDSFIQKISEKAPVSSINLINKKVIDGTILNLEINQISTEVFRVKKFGGVEINPNAFEIIFTEC